MGNQKLWGNQEVDEEAELGCLVIVLVILLVIALGFAVRLFGWVSGLY